MSTNPFALSSIEQEGRAQAPATDNPYSLNNIARDQQQDLRVELQRAVRTNPDEAAEVDRLAKRYPAPKDVLLSNLQDTKLQAAVDQADEALRTSPKLAEYMRTSPWGAKQAHDDIAPLADIERTFGGTVRDVGTVAIKGAVGLPQAIVGLADIVTGGYAGKGVEALGIDFKRAQNILAGNEGDAPLSYSPAQQSANKNVNDADGFLGTLSAMVQKPSTIATMVGESLPQLLGGAAAARGILQLGSKTLTAGAVGPQLPGLMARAFGEKTATVLAGAFGEGLMAAGSAAENMRADNTDGLISAKETFASVGLGAGTALFGVFGGKVAQKLGLDDIDTVLASKGLAPEAADKVKQGFVSAVLKSGISEGVFEELPQSVQEQMWQNWANDKPLGEGVGKAAAQGVVAGFAMGGGFQAINRAGEHFAAIGESDQQSARLQEALQAATQSKLRERNPEEFRTLVQQMAENTEGAPAEVFVDAEVLNQLAPEVLAQLPGVAEQMEAALAANDVVSIPMADVLTVAPGTPLEAMLVENARIGDPRAMSQAEAKDAGAKAQEFLAQEAQRVIQQATDQQAMQESSDRVKQGVLDQLNTVGRFRKDVNEAYATWTAAFYTTMAGRMGLTPEQMRDKYPLKIAGQAGQGAVLNTGGMAGEMTVEGYHFSMADRPTLTTTMYGTGLKGSARGDILNNPDKRLKQRLSFYFDKGTGISPESGVGGRAHRVQLSGVYDADADPLKLKTGNARDLESKLLDLGYKGYANRMEGTQPGQVVMLGEQNFTPELLGAVSKIDAGERVAPLDPAAPQWRPHASGDTASLQARIERMKNSTSWANYDMRIEGNELQVREKAGLLNQSATLRSGEETLAKYGLPLGGKYNTRDIAAALEARQREKWGKIDPTDRSPEAVAKIADWMAEEVRFEMQHPRKSGVGWYSYKFQRALDTFGEVFPELKKDKDARATLTALIAITSDGQKVLPNFRMAVDLYDNFRKTGKFSTERGHQRMDSIQGNVELLQKLLDDKGPKAMRKYLLQEATVSELRKRAKAEGVEFKTDYQANIKLPMAAVTFGPKLGAFYANLMGASGYLTMDRWWSRTFNRYRGTLLQAPTRQGLDRFKELLGNPALSDDEVIAATVEPRKSYEAKNFKNGTEIEKAANTIYKAAFENLEDAPFNATDRTFMLEAVAKAQQVLEAEGRKISVADIQAVLWYYEKRLYGELGARQTADVSYEDAAKKVVAEQTDTGATGGSDAPGAGTGTGENDNGSAIGVSGEAVPPGLEPFDAGEVNGRLEQAGDGGGRDQGGSLAPLEGAPNVLGATGPDPRLVAVAEQYARDNGIELKRQAEYAKVDEARAARIAQAYAEMQHAPNDPKVKEAYADLIQQTRAQYDALVAAGYEFTFFDDKTDPYGGNPWEAMRDLRANQRMAVYGTYAGFGVGADINVGLADPAGGANLDPEAVLAAVRAAGGDVIGSVIHNSATEPTLVVKVKTKLDDATADALSATLGQEAIAQSFEDGTGQLYGPQAANWGTFSPDFFVTADGRRASETLNPLLADTGLRWPDQNGVEQPVKANDLFRAVHDAFGHGMEGAGFRALGEENAWQAHVRLFTGPAVGAITTETRGQNSWLNFGPYGEKNQTANVEDTVFAEQKTGLLPEWAWTEGRVGDQSEVLNQGPRGTFNPKTLELALNENADLSTFLHETGHFFLEVMADLANQPNAPAGIVSDMNALMKWFGVADAATWNAMTLDQKRPYHERFAESFEEYLLSGKAPSLELQPLFRKFRAWMLNVYKSLKAFVDGRTGETQIQLSDEIRQVFDRMLASDEQIQQANEVAGLLPNEEADAEANEKLTARSLRDLKWTVNARAKEIKKLQAQAKSLRKDVEAEVTAEVNQMPEFAAKDALDKIRKENKGPPNDTELATVADAFGYPDADTMLTAIDAIGKKADVIEGMTDQRMLERHGDLIDQRAIEQAANEAVHNEARARSLATELKTQAEMLNPRTDTGNVSKSGSKITVNALAEAAKQFAANVVSTTPLRDLKSKAWQHTAAERRAGKRWQEATTAGKTQDAVKAKQDQMLNNAAAKAAMDAQTEMRKILEFFKRVIKDNNEKVVDKGRDPDVVNAARAVLAAYGVAPRAGKTALEYMALVEKNDPTMFAALQPAVQGALNMAQPLESLTMEELRGLHEEIQGMWHLAERSRRIEVDGNLMDMDDAEAELQARMQEIGVPDTMPGDSGALTRREELARKLQHVGSLLRRTEQWAQGMGKEFTRLVFQVVKNAANAYRTDRVKYRKAYQALVDAVAPNLTKGTIAAPELGYTFGKGHNGIGHAELLHAILHTGNASNKRKLLLGRGWATENADGSLDTSKWDAFLQRMHDTGGLNKAHYDFAQGVWDLLEKTKPLAQKTHRDVFGRYFAEVTADTFTTPFGDYRGGYVPAQADPRIVQDADLRKLAEAENENMAFSFPGTNKGFTKGRVDYNRPLMLDLRTIGQHIDKVLLFSHMEPAVRDVQRLLSRKGVSYSLGRIDPTIYAGMLTPWLNRSARQIVETPIVGDGGISRVLSAARNRAGMVLMFANISNTLQQLTGFSLAAVKVKPSSMMRATTQFVASPKKTAKTVSDASEFMANRMGNEIAAVNDAMDEILLDPSLYKKATAWSQKHAYFLQTAMANTMEPIIWTAAYNDALAEGQSEKDAVHHADSVIRTTQGSTLPEDVSRIETGPAYARIFTQFVGYFNMMANTNATALKQVSQEMGLKKGAGKALGVVTLGMLVPLWIAEAIAQAMRGGPEDEDDDGYLDDWLAAVFGMGTIKGTFAMVPFVGQLANAGINRFNGNPADDKMSLSPAVSLLESAVGVPVAVYKTITDPDKLNARNAVRDVASAVSLATGLPATALARPVGYMAGVADDRIDPTGPVDMARGLVTGTPSPASK